MESAKLFSSISSDYEKALKESLWKIHRFMGLSMDEVYRMTVADRLLYTSVHNRLSQEESEKYRKNG